MRRGLAILAVVFGGWSPAFADTPTADDGTITVVLVGDVGQSINGILGVAVLLIAMTGAIIWWDEDKGPVTGRAARRVIRQSARHVVST